MVNKSGFTIVEVLVVTAIIGIMSITSIILYMDLSQKALVSAIKTDLKEASQKIKLFKVTNNAYPVTLDCGVPDSRTNLCIGFKNSYTYNYNYDNSSSNKHFGLSLASSMALLIA